MKTWETTHKGHQIKVQNGWFKGERLYVDGELQDQQMGWGLRSRLFGRLTNGEVAAEPIKVSLGGWFIAGCRIFISDKLIYAGN